MNNHSQNHLRPSRYLNKSPFRHSYSLPLNNNINTFPLPQTNEYGKYETIKQQIKQLFGDSPPFTILSFGTGTLTMEEAEIAIETKARILLVDIELESDIEYELLTKEVFFKNYKLLHHLLDDLESHSNEYLKNNPLKIANEDAGKVMGKAHIVRRIMLTKKKDIAGIKVTEGVLRSQDLVRIFRDGELVADDVVLKEMKNGRTLVKETQVGNEAGICFQSSVDFEEGDLIEAYISEF